MCEAFPLFWPGLSFSLHLSGPEFHISPNNPPPILSQTLSLNSDGVRLPFAPRPESPSSRLSFLDPSFPSFLFPFSRALRATLRDEENPWIDLVENFSQTESVVPRLWFLLAPFFPFSQIPSGTQRRCSTTLNLERSLFFSHPRQFSRPIFRSTPPWALSPLIVLLPAPGFDFLRSIPSVEPSGFLTMQTLDP